MNFEDKSRTVAEPLLEKEQFLSLRSPAESGLRGGVENPMNQSYEPMSYLNLSKVKAEDSDD